MEDKTIKFIHVAGTNGKGSVCAYITDSLVCTGKRVGKFTSPHIASITERITVNNIPISDYDFERLCGWVDCPKDTPQFERIMKAAFIYFKEQEVEYAVIETGIGGLFDCTNIISPIVSVITRIDYDHTGLLGDTIEEIARHKAGIIKQGIPVVVDAFQPLDAMKIIREAANAKKSKVILPNKDERFDIKMIGEHQNNNASIAAEVLRLIGITPSFSKTVLKARVEVVSENPLIIVDGGHNPNSLRALFKTVDETFNRNKIIIFGMLCSKDYDTCLKILKESNCRIILTDGFSENSVKCGNVSTADAIKKATEMYKDGDVILVCGSFYLAGEAIEVVKRLKG